MQQKFYAIFLIIIHISLRFASSSNGNERKKMDLVKARIPLYSFSGGFFRQLLPTKNISTLLDNLLKGYDPKLRPRFGGPPTIVEIDVEVRSMGKISELDMTYSMDCYFRQSWVDERLAFSETEEAFTLSLAVLERLWKPDTFIYNGKHSYPHLITTPNKFVRLHHSGKVFYSSRLTIQATCPMNLEDFPMDTQKCPLKLGSFGYTTKDVLYRWNNDRQLVIAQDMKLSQFDLIAAPSGFENITRRSDEHSTLLASFYLQRHMGNFLIQVYGPCMLLVVLSWVSFWLNREATADRISLGVTTVLTMTFLGLDARTDLPKVSYSTALDLFVWISFAFIFATIIEFAFVHYFTKFGSGEDLLLLEDEKEEDENDDDKRNEVSPQAENLLQLQVVNRNRCRISNASWCQFCSGRCNPMHCRCINDTVFDHDGQLENVVFHSSLPRHIERNLNVPSTALQRTTSAVLSEGESIMTIPIREEPLTIVRADVRKLNRLQSESVEDVTSHSGPTLTSSEVICVSCHSKLSETQLSDCNKNNQRRHRKCAKTIYNEILAFCCKGRCNIVKARRRVKQARAEEALRRVHKDKRMNSVSKMDEVSRIMFPVAFLLINLLYWYSYLAHSQRLMFHLQSPKQAQPPQ